MVEGSRAPKTDAAWMHHFQLHLWKDAVLCAKPVGLDSTCMSTSYLACLHSGVLHYTRVNSEDPCNADPHKGEIVEHAS